MRLNPVEPDSVRPSAVWNEAVREFLRTRHGQALSTHESAEYQRLREGYIRAVRHESGDGADAQP
ncbi:hypothetical protein OG204_02755 [Streptomyces sp. NBC_01387]|uniref:hypothetical protein n=1 Tax=unclassified Streptomyces TaxID=2593676 RepID=UPI00225AF818|nr:MULTISPECIES: hypothetical protein [unclassified Streptomyces]MCX4552792.1 hypothetical protein [Streptomyces sp. NBC_01500]WSC24126.1 hypothetical protein OIE60_33090 [Streptomyces sp. NBC_01766]